MVVLMSSFFAASNVYGQDVTLLGSWSFGTTKAKEIGEKRLLVVTVTGEIGVMNNLTDISLTYGGQAMNKVVSTSEGTTAYGNFSYIFTLNEAGIAAADETGTIVPSWTTTAPAGSDIFSAFYSNVDQTTPVSDTSFVHLNGTLVTAPSVTAALGDVALMSVAFAGQPRTPNYTTGFTEILKNPTGQSWGSGIIAEKAGDGTEVIPSITNSSSERAALTCVVLKKAKKLAPPVTLLGNWTAGTLITQELGNNRMLVAVVGTEHGGINEATSMTYGNQPMTRVIEFSSDPKPGSSYTEYTAIFILKDAGIKAATHDTIKVSWKDTPGEGYSVSSAFYSNVDQLADIDTTTSTSLTSSLKVPAMNVGMGDIYITGCALGDPYTSIDNGFTEELIQLKNSIAFGTDLRWGFTVIHSKLGTGVADSATITRSAGRGGLCGIVLKKAELVAPPTTLLGNWTAGTLITQELGNNRMLVAVVGTEHGGINEATSMTYGNQPMTRVIEFSSDPKPGSSYTEYTAIFILKDAGIKAATHDTIKVSWKDTPGEGYSVSSAFYSNVDQSAEINTTTSTSLTSSLKVPAMNVGKGDFYITGCALGDPYTSIDNGFTEELIQLKNSTAFGTDLRWGFTVIHSKLGTGVADSATITRSAGRGGLCGIVLKHEEEIFEEPSVYYDLIANASTGGTIELAPNRVKFLEGAIVKVKAVPDFGYYFVNWTDSLNTVVTDTTILMNSNKVITANFAEKIKYTITTEVSNGSIYLTPTGGTYYEGVEVTLVAQPHVGYKFMGWSGDLSGSENPVSVVMDKNYLVTAVIEQIAAYTLSVSGTNGFVSVSPQKVTYEPNEAVVLIAMADEGYRFLDWSGDITGTENPTAVFMTEDKTIVANFEVIPPSYTITKTATNGTITMDPPGGVYEEGTVVTVTAAPNEKYLFAEWAGDLSGTVNPQTITVDGDMSISATFIKDVTGIDYEGSGNNNMEQNFPNPFSTSTTISYQLNVASHVNISVYNILGEKIVVLVNEKHAPGHYTVDWNSIDKNGNQLVNGIYIYRLDIDNKPVKYRKASISK